MKVQCPRCREIVLMKEFSTSDTGLQFRCSDCNEINYIPSNNNLPSEENRPCLSKGAAAAAVHAAPPHREQGADDRKDENGISCPKCGHFQSDPDACNLCGLLFTESVKSALPEDPAEAAASWRDVLSRPDDMERHERFLEICTRADRIDFAAKQYRILGRDPEMAETAQAMMSRIHTWAQRQLTGHNPGAALETGSRNKKWILYSAILLVVILGSFYLLSFARGLIVDLK